jgi:hypothetical protein
MRFLSSASFVAVSPELKPLNSSLTLAVETISSCSESMALYFEPKSLGSLPLHTLKSWKFPSLGPCGSVEDEDTEDVEDELSEEKENLRSAEDEGFEKLESESVVSAEEGAVRTSVEDVEEVEKESVRSVEDGDGRAEDDAVRTSIEDNDNEEVEEEELGLEGDDEDPEGAAPKWPSRPKATMPRPIALNRGSSCGWLFGASPNFLFLDNEEEEEEENGSKGGGKDATSYRPPAQASREISLF